MTLLCHRLSSDFIFSKPLDLWKQFMFLWCLNQIQGLLGHMFRVIFIHSCWKHTQHLSWRELCLPANSWCVHWHLSAATWDCSLPGKIISWVSGTCVSVSMDWLGFIPGTWSGRMSTFTSVVLRSVPINESKKTQNKIIRFREHQPVRFVKCELSEWINNYLMSSC